MTDTPDVSTCRLLARIALMNGEYGRARWWAQRADAMERALCREERTK